jgi:hypothetical protein
MGSIIDRAFNRAYNEAVDCCNNGELRECAKKCNEILDDGASPRYHQMKLRILLGSILGDSYEAWRCFLQAESMWRIVRRWHPIGEDAAADEALEELRVALAELKEELEKEDQMEDAEEAIEDEKASNAHEDADALREVEAAMFNSSLQPPEVQIQVCVVCPSLRIFLTLFTGAIAAILLFLCLCICRRRAQSEEVPGPGK